MEHGWEIAGLLVNTTGVLILFRFGMPFRVERKGARYLLLEGDEGDDTEGIKTERRYKVLGWLGIAMVLIGAALQVRGLMDA